MPEPFDHPDWWFEAKYDGFRALAYIQNGKAELVSRKGDGYQCFEPLRAQLGSLGHEAILDGEIALVDGSSAPTPGNPPSRRAPVLYAFDCLWLDGRDLRYLPLIVRKGILEGIVPENSAVSFARHVEGSGVELFRVACERDLEGIVCKHKLSTYGSEELPWIEVLNPNYSQRGRRRESFEKRRSGARWLSP